MQGFIQYSSLKVITEGKGPVLGKQCRILVPAPCHECHIGRPVPLGAAPLQNTTHISLLPHFYWNRVSSLQEYLNLVTTDALFRLSCKWHSHFVLSKGFRMSRRDQEQHTFQVLWIFSQQSKSLLFNNRPTAPKEIWPYFPFGAQHCLSLAESTCWSQGEFFTRFYTSVTASYSANSYGYHTPLKIEVNKSGCISVRQSTRYRTQSCHPVLHQFGGSPSSLFAHCHDHQRLLFPV